MKVMTRETVKAYGEGQLRRQLLHEKRRYQILRELFIEGQSPDIDLENWERRVALFFKHEDNIWEYQSL